MRLQDLLKQQRLQNHYTQAQLAQRLFVSTQAVSKWEHGQSVPTIDNLLALSDLYNLSLDELVQGSPFFKKPYVVGHRYRRSRVLLLLGAWLLLSIFLSGFDFKNWSILTMIVVFGSGYLIPILTNDYWVIEATQLKWRHYGKGFIFKQLLERQPKLETMAYTEMAQATIYYQVRQRVQPFDYGSDDFKLIITAKDGRHWALELGAHVQDFLPQFVNYLVRQGVPVADDDGIVELLLRGDSLYNHFNAGKRGATGSN
ncbi:helix-turn-helix domain-containing protein [Lactiplantibacillus daowaiensis]|uniref:Helix-turn-helix domain-containing protein n=1 Tax=Lactiplantibacillus daowaiensis TaxID=2559918 RepID=A0ABW1RYI5_9LACO|nr:helix-turn-helix transcriptional regulator [Lactiplantibacillus daowaiensis]